MSTPTLEELAAVVETLRSELDEAKKQLRGLEKVISIYEEDGVRYAEVECTGLVVRPAEDQRFIAVHLGTSEKRPFLHMINCTRDETHVGVFIGYDGSDDVDLRLQGADYKPRVQLTVQNDHGVAAVFAPGHKPGAVMKAQPGGGSMGVTQPDGKARAVLIHKQGDPSSEEGSFGATELLFAQPSGRTLMALRVDEGGSMIAAGTPERRDCAVITARAGATAMLIRSPEQGHGTTAAMVATEELAQLFTYRGEDPASGGQAALSSHAALGPSLTLDRPDGTRGIDLQVTANAASIELLDQAGVKVASLGYFDDLRNASFSLTSAGKTEGIRALATPMLNAFSVFQPGNKDSQVCLLAKQESVSVGLVRDSHTLVHLGHAEHGGVVTALGQVESAGTASINGGTAAGSVVLGSADGTTLAALGGSDHGGQLTLNNDLGFPRARLGTFDESSVLLLNHTGQDGVSAAAGPFGGLITVHDTEGRVRCTLPEDGTGEEEE